MEIYEEQTNTRSLFLCVYTNIESLVEVVPVPNQAYTQTLIIRILYNNSYQRLDMFRGVYCEVWVRLSAFFHMAGRFSLFYCRFMTLAGFSFTISPIGQMLFFVFVKSNFQVLKHSIPRLQCRVYTVDCFQHSCRFTFFYKSQIQNA